MSKIEGILIPGYVKARDDFWTHAAKRDRIKRASDNTFDIAFRNFKKPAHLRAELYESNEENGETRDLLYVIHRADLLHIAAAVRGRVENVGHSILIDGNDGWFTHFSVKKAWHRDDIREMSDENLQMVQRSYQELGIVTALPFHPKHTILNLLKVRNPVH